MCAWCIVIFSLFQQLHPDSVAKFALWQKRFNTAGKTIFKLLADVMSISSFSLLFQDFLKKASQWLTRTLMTSLVPSGSAACAKSSIGSLDNSFAWFQPPLEWHPHHLFFPLLFFLTRNKSVTIRQVLPPSLFIALGIFPSFWDDEVVFTPKSIRRQLSDRTSN